MHPTLLIVYFVSVRLLGALDVFALCLFPTQNLAHRAWRTAKRKRLLFWADLEYADDCFIMATRGDMTLGEIWPGND